LFEALIKKMGQCTSRTFSNAVLGLEWAQTHELDLVIVDT
jgi:hypothetical protein